MKVKNIVQVVWKYTAKDWKEKNEYLTVGVLLIKDDWQMSIHLKCNPRLDLSDWWLNVYSQKKKEKTIDDIGWDVDDDLPF